jgi:hypothetical protein
MTTETRNVYFKRDAQYIYKNVSLLRGLSITKPKGCRAFELRINGIPIRPTDEDSKTAKWDFAEVRHRVSEDFEHNEMLKLHETFVYQSIQAFPHYTTVPIIEFTQTLFTQDLRIQVCPPHSISQYEPFGGRIEFFEGSEEVFESDVKKGISKP